jgi:glucose-1-phosphate thymidylyltransferase
MKLIIPMAGIGKRLRPHTLLTPKPLLKVAGITIVERIILGLKTSCGKPIDEIHFVIGQFGKDAEVKLKDVSAKIGAKAYIHYQDEPLGTAHAVFCAKEALNSEVCIAFADTLYIGDIKIEENDEAIIWTYEVDNPESYGVVVTERNDKIVNFIEKPVDRISNRAIVGMYYFKNAELLRNSISDLIDSGRKINGEYQLTESLKDLRDKGLNFISRNLKNWLDFGNKENFLNSVKELLKQISIENSGITNFKVIPPIYIGANTRITNSTLGPFVIVEDNSVIDNSIITNSVIGESNYIGKSDISRSLIGNFNYLNGIRGILNLGDYNEYTP